MDLESCAAQLYAIPPGEFVQRRTELAAQARASGDRALAKAIGALRRPTRAAWLANLVAREAPEELGALLDLGPQLREAQAQLDGPALRRLSSQRTQAVGTLARRVAALAAEHDQPATDAQIQEVAQLVQAALADEEMANTVRRGQIAQPVTVGGFGPWSPATGKSTATAASVGSHPAAQPEEAAEHPPAGPSPEQIAAARAAWELAEQAVRGAEVELAKAEQRAESAASELTRARAELARVETAEEQARAAEAAVEDRLRSLQADAEERRRHLQSLVGEA